MKLSEARIIIYLDNTRRDIRYAAQIALKLDIDDSNVNKVLKKMAAKEWVKLSLEDGKNIYTITSKCPIQGANEVHQG